MSNLLILNSWRSQHVFCPRPGVTLIGVVGKPAAHWQIRRSTIRMQRPRIGGSPTILWSCTLVCLQVTWGIFWHIVHSWFWDWTWRRNPWKETLDIFPNLAFRISFILQQDVTSGKIKRCRWFLDAAYLQNMNVVWNHHVNFLVDMRNIV